MIYDILARGPARGKWFSYQTHIVCEPVVLEGLHVLSRHYENVSELLPRSGFVGLSYTVRHSL